MNGDHAGTLRGIARRPAHRTPMVEVTEAFVSEETGLEGDYKGAKFPLRRITILSLEAWLAALKDLQPLDTGDDPAKLPWTVRRANLLVSGVVLPKARGGLIAIGDLRLEVTYPTQPCNRMDEAFPGLLKALHPDWRGGVTCKVLAGGLIRVGDPVDVLYAPPEQKIRLPS